MSIDYPSLSAGLCRIAVAAGADIMRHYEGGPVDVTQKQDDSPVTAADQDAEALILKGLAELAPDIPVVSEEAAAAGHIPVFGDVFFLVDPLDGTREFINKNGEFTVNIALIEKGEPTCGVVYAPAKQRLFYACGPAQAYEQDVEANTAGDLSKAPPPRRIKVRAVPETGMVAVASRSHRDQKTDEYLDHYNVTSFITAGSSLKFCLLAAGEADIYPRHGRTMEWDTAAGHAVLSAAGGSVTELDGTPLRYGKTERGMDNPYFVAKTWKGR
ncbi:3'(2'),5'-bisphosphate nucleotidase [Tepidicaulis marinus]|uniref:3'(2'),5'-bisphosphate nucleotidase CysQ n=1 Tax=Tepidicaulis marinus TaxID=1333998 RepID=A0A081BEJ9_9HYPH|nr:3'(2'),5'-bisphosphate nucleotidase CysQ [Tepidicaulis marinus]GAK46467.1 3'(2'),5'-bisphosphate nucleotidase [Tepidicaulis marinus]